MNQLNHCSLAAAKRLQAAGITLETDFMWVRNDSGWSLLPNSSIGVWAESLPAPSMAEVWRELPDGSLITKHWKKANKSACWCVSSPYIENQNPTDALVDLLIWVRKEKA